MSVERIENVRKTAIFMKKMVDSDRQKRYKLGIQKKHTFLLDIRCIVLKKQRSIASLLRLNELARSYESAGFFVNIQSS